MSYSTTLSVTQMIYADTIIRAFTWLSRLRRPALTAEARVQLQVSPCGICGGQSGIATGFASSTSVLLLVPQFSCWYYTSALDSRIHLSPTLYNLGNCQRLNIFLTTIACHLPLLLRHAFVRSVKWATLTRLGADRKWQTASFMICSPA